MSGTLTIDESLFSVLEAPELSANDAFIVGIERNISKGTN